MKGMTGRFLQQIRFIASVSTLKEGLAFHQNPKQDPMNIDLHDFVVFDPKDAKPELDFDLGNKESIAEHGNVSESETENQEEIYFSQFKQKCPPGGENSVIFYTTSLRGVRETSDACNYIRSLLENLKVAFQERDVSMDLDFRQEMRSLLGCTAIPPRLFIKGRYIGGAEDVLELNERGMFRKLLEGTPLATSKCQRCWNERFLICWSCNGSSKVFVDESDDAMWRRCMDCNENGLVKCPICS